MKRLNKILPLLPIAAALAPLMVSAQDPVGTMIGTLTGWARLLITLFMVLAVVVFLWGIVKYITAGGDSEKEKTARGYIIYGLIGIFVLVGFMGIIAVVARYFGVSTGGTIDVPTPGF